MSVSKGNRGKTKKPVSKGRAAQAAAKKHAAPRRRAAAPKPAQKSAAKPSRALNANGSLVKSISVKPGTKLPPSPTKKPVVVVAGPVPVSPDPKAKPKGITIVTAKPPIRPKSKKPIQMPNMGEPLLGGKKKWKPLIPSGPNASVGVTSGSGGGARGTIKTKLTKKELDRYREILRRKRAELVGDVSTMETEALTGSSGSLSHLPQHMADQGSETFDQALSLDLAKVDRNLIREIDEALARIEAGTFGVCELTGKPIAKDRLEELPWTRYSIEAARELERRTHHA
ncbi:MAG: TraR/DksA C4-type zinc finger protein [Phycisphaerae bacterium]|nr:TraR/DksA C4-type zinc finger protein [Phycisphaerae bacterium]